jgi:hypothetical protein
MAIHGWTGRFGGLTAVHRGEAITAVLAAVVVLVMLGTGSSDAISVHAGSVPGSADAATHSPIVVGADSPKVLSSCKVGKNPMGVAYDPADEYVYVANSGHLVFPTPQQEGTVSVIEPGCKVIHTIKLAAGSCPYGIAYDPENTWMYVTDLCDPYIYVISGLQVIHRINYLGNDNGFSVAYDPATGDMLVSDFYQDGLGIAVYHGTELVGGNTELCGASGWECPSYSSIAVVDGRVFAGAPGIVVMFDAKSYDFISWFSIPCSEPVLGAMTFDLRTRILLYGDTTTGTYCGVSPQTHAYVFNQTITSLPAVAGIAYSPATSGIYIVGGGGPYPWAGFTQNSSDVWVESPSNHLTVVRLADDANAYDLAFNPSNRMMYVSGAGTDTVYVVG